MKHILPVALLACATLAMNSCKCERNKTTDGFEIEANMMTEASKTSVEEDLNKSKTILYTIPSPVEVASIIKDSGVKYHDDILSNLQDADKYNTNLKMALNLGIYTTDMSLASIFNQSQKTVEYLNTIKTLTDRLGIVQLLNDETIMQLEEKRSSKDEILNLISEVYINANQYLTENNRKNIAAIVLVGGWTEGLYVALNLSSPEKQNRMLSERIIAQKMALATVITIVNENNPNGTDEDLNYLAGKLNEIKMIFDGVNIESSQIMVVTDAESHLTRIKANEIGNISVDMIELLREQVTMIRNEFVAQ